MSNKPEWFELAGEEPKLNSPESAPTVKSKVKSKKRFAKIALLTAPLLIIGGALVFAEGDEGDDAPKMDTTIPAATVNSSTTSTQSNSATAIKVSQASTKNVATNTSSGVTNPATNNPATGVGVPAPSGRGGEGHEGREGHERPHHEGGEHEFGGDDD